MKYKCYCGQNFSLNAKDTKRILPKQELFCSVECFHQYILDFQPQTKEMSYMLSSGMVSDDADCWDYVTKAKYRSKYEVYVARFLTFKDIPFYYERYTIPINKKCYTPDFFLPELNLFIEVKGVWAWGSKQKFLKAQEKVDLVLLPSYLQRDFAKNYKEA